MSSVAFDEDTTKRVARLSITAQDIQRAEISNMLKDSQAMSPINESTDSLDTSGVKATLFKKKDRRKRRRSSIQQTSTQVTKKKLLVPSEFKLNEDRLLMKKLSVSNLRDLLLWLLTDTNNNPKWLTFTNRSAIKNVTVVFVSGLVLPDFGYETLEEVVSPQEIRDNDWIPFFKDRFNSVLPVQSPGSKECIYSTYLALTNTPLSKKEKLKIKLEDLKNKIYLPDLLMSYEELLLHRYPIHPSTPKIDSSIAEKYPLESEWVETKVFKHEGSKTFALDCEMCLSAKGKELTRISVVDFNNKVIMDEFVKPKEEIIDYVTQYSGITPENLANVTTTLKDIQEKFLSLISADDILIGHSLESDLNVMKVRHPLIVDTAIIYEHPRGPPAKASLKWLTKTFLNRDIQLGTDGHSSVEDAESCMELVKLKLINGSSFGKNVNEESLLKKIYEVSHANKVSKSSVVIDYTIARNTSDEEKCEKRVQCFNDDQIVEKVISHASSFNLVISRLRELEVLKKFGYTPRDAEIRATTLEEAYKNLNDRLERIYEGLPDSSALLVLSGNGDPVKMFELQNKKKQFHKEYETKKWDEVQAEWNLNHLEELKRATLTARDSVAFVCVKNKALEHVLALDGTGDNEESAVVSSGEEEDEEDDDNDKST